MSAQAKRPMGAWIVLLLFSALAAGGTGCASLRTTPLVSSSANAAGFLSGAAWDGTLALGRSSATAGDKTVAAVAAAARGSGRFVGRAGSLTGAMAIDAMDANPGEHAGFLEQPEQLVERARSDHPFQRVWVAPGLDLAAYDRIQIVPVDSGHVLQNNLWDRFSTASFFGLQDDVPRLADRLHGSLVKAFSDDPNARFTVVDHAGERTLVLEISLVEVVPNKSFLALAALAAMAAPPAISTSIGTLASTAGDGVVAIEGRVRDGATGELLAMFADRESGKTRVLDLQSVRWYGHAYEIFDDWAEQLVAVADHPERPGIKDPAPFTLRPW